MTRAPADFLCAAIGFPTPAFVVTPLPEGTHCVSSGLPIREGVPALEVITDATNEVQALFPGGLDGYVSVAFAVCWRNAAPSAKYRVGEREVANPCAKAHAAVEQPDGSVWYVSPAVDPVTALANSTRPWSEVARELLRDHLGRPCFLLATTETKKRFWPLARSGVLGERTAIYVQDKKLNLDGQFFVNWARLVDRLDVVEGLLAEGYSKASIQESLLSAPNATLEKIGALSVPKRPGEKAEDHKARCLAQGRLQAAAAEKDVRPLRGSTEFLLAVMMSARTLSAEETGKALQKKQAEREAQSSERAAKKGQKAAAPVPADESAEVPA